MVAFDLDLVVLLSSHHTDFCGLLLGGIRSAGFESVGAKVLPLVINSLLETNLGMPYVFCIYIAYSSRFTEQFKRREKVSFTERIEEWNGERVNAVSK